MKRPTQKELLTLLRAARDAQDKTKHELAGSDNPQTKAMHDRADARAYTLHCVIHAVLGDRVLLKLLGE